MGLNRLLRRWGVGAMLVAVLFAQLATAAYACPAMGRASGEVPEAMAGMPCAEMMAGTRAVDDTQSGLCFEHCQADTGQVPADPSQLANVPAAALAAFFVVLPPLAQEGIDTRWPAAGGGCERAPPDAHRVVHCCWRL